MLNTSTHTSHMTVDVNAHSPFNEKYKPGVPVIYDLSTHFQKLSCFLCKHTCQSNRPYQIVKKCFNGQKIE